MRLSISFLVVLACCCSVALSDATGPIYYYPATSHWYQIVSVNSGISHSYAATLAATYTVKSSKGYPWTINDINEANFVYPIISAWNATAQGSNGQSSWIGIKKIGNTFVWEAVVNNRQSQPFYNVSTNSCIGYCNFTSTPTTSDQCGVVYLGAGTPPCGSWGSNTCGGLTQSLVIEYDADTTCPSGYSFYVPNGTCQDVNECLNTKACPTGYTCQNTVGSYNCIAPATAAPTTPPTAAPSMAPTSAPTTAPSTAPTSAPSTAPSTAPTSAPTTAPTMAPTKAPTTAPTTVPTTAPTTPPTTSPTNAPTTAAGCSPACGSGYTCNAGTCTDIDECAAASGVCGSPGVCASGYYCQNTPGSWQCNDVNECGIPHSCLSGYTCNNTYGSYYCTDIDECATGTPCGPQFTCTNTPGSYECNAENTCLTNGCPYGSNCTLTTGGYYACKAWRFWIVSVMDDQVIAVNTTSTVADPGTGLVTASMVSGTTQLWRFTPDGYLQSVYFNLVIDRETVGNTIYAVLNNADSASTEFWTYNSTALTIESTTDDFVLDIYAAWYGSDVPVIVYRDKYYPEYLANQQWNLKFAGLDS